MAGPRIEIHANPMPKPVACHTPATIPFHWPQQVHDDLLRDEAMGILEKVPLGEPTEWCQAWSLPGNMMDLPAALWICHH